MPNKWKQGAFKKENETKKGLSMLQTQYLQLFNSVQRLNNKAKEISQNVEQKVFFFNWNMKKQFSRLNKH